MLSTITKRENSGVSNAGYKPVPGRVVYNGGRIQNGKTAVSVGNTGYILLNRVTCIQWRANTKRENSDVSKAGYILVPGRVVYLSLIHI